MLNWNEIYSAKEYIYGTRANDFLIANTEKLKPGKVLCLADGEGRNSVYLAQRGFEVTAVDASIAGIEKARHLAGSENVDVEYIHADLADYVIEKNTWDSIVSISCHLPLALRQIVHRAVVEGLKAGGILLLEAYRPKQLEYGTGGPPVAEMMMTKECLRDELKGLEFLHLEELDREVIEGTKHTGMAAVVQAIARK